MSHSIKQLEKAIESHNGDIERGYEYHKKWYYSDKKNKELYEKNNPQMFKRLHELIDHLEKYKNDVVKLSNNASVKKTAVRQSFLNFNWADLFQ